MTYSCFMVQVINIFYSFLLFTYLFCPLDYLFIEFVRLFLCVKPDALIFYTYLSLFAYC